MEFLMWDKRKKYQEFKSLDLHRGIIICWNFKVSSRQSAVAHLVENNILLVIHFREVVQQMVLEPYYYDNVILHLMFLQQNTAAAQIPIFFFWMKRFCHDCMRTFCCPNSHICTYKWDNINYCTVLFSCLTETLEVIVFDPK